MEAKRKVDVLVVDDQPNNLLALEAILDGMGVNLVRARSGEEALMRVLDDDFAVILMDVQMPGMDGFEAAALIRERDHSQHTPIIFLTAFQSTEGQVFQGYALGAVDFLTKPIVPAVLRSKVAVFVELFEKTEQVKLQAAQLNQSQRREHERELAEEKRRWELERLQEEAARERKSAEKLAKKAEELSRTVTERARAEQEVRERAAQQAIVAELGRRALAGIDLSELLEDAVAKATRDLRVRFGRVMELAPDGVSLHVRAAIGWEADGAGHVTVGVGNTSLAGYTLLCNQPIAVEDLRTETRFDVSPLLRDNEVLGGLSVMIQGRDRPFGTLEIFSDHPRCFSQDDIHFLQSVANVLATAIQRKGDEQELAAVRDQLAVQLDDMTRLHALGARLSNSLELATVLQEVLSAVTGLQGTDRGVLMLRERGRPAMVTAASVGFTAEQLDPVAGATTEVASGQSMTAVISGGLVMEDAQPDPVFAPHLAAALSAGCHAMCSTPLLTTGGELIGTIATYFPRPHLPDARETRMVELYARQAAEFIDNARLYREIRDADRRKSEFLAMLSHELRNPLSPILNAVHLLRLQGNENRIQQEARTIIERQVGQLSHLIDDLLEVARFTSGKIRLHPVRLDMRDVVERAVESARPLIDRRRHVLTVSVPADPVWLHADPARLEQVVVNLLNNAAKYTDEGGRIGLVLRQLGAEMVLSVRDTGIGIDLVQFPDIFDLFTQADRSLDRSQGGLGIGLSLVKRLVDMHRGTVAVHSEGLGRGSEFTIRLPLTVAAPEPSSTPAGSAELPAHSRRVLVVDDNVNSAETLAALLRLSGHDVRTAYTGPTSLEAAVTHLPDVVLLDIGLPGLSGYEVARRLRQDPQLKDVRLVAMTGYGEEADRLLAQEAGFDRYVVKPVDFSKVEKLLTTLLTPPGC